jgi:hypothetical protein
MSPLAVRVHADRQLSGRVQPPSPSGSDVGSAAAAGDGQYRGCGRRLERQRGPHRGRRRASRRHRSGAGSSAAGLPPEPADAPAGSRGTVPPRAGGFTMDPLTGTVRGPSGSAARVRSVTSWRSFCSTESWGTATGRGDTLTKAVTAGAVTRPGTFAPENP